MTSHRRNLWKTKLTQKLWIVILCWGEESKRESKTVNDEYELWLLFDLQWLITTYLKRTEMFFDRFCHLQLQLILLNNLNRILDVEIASEISLPKKN